MDLSIIIVNYKSKAKLINCLDSIGKSDLSDLKYEVVIVDNDSGDDLSDLKYEYKFVSSPKNLGMGAGNNLGIKNSQGEFILISNPDIVYEPNTIKTLFLYLKNNLEVGLVGPKLLNSDGSLQYSCVRFPKFYIPILRRTFVGHFFPARLNHYLMKNEDHDIVREADWLLGACFMVRRPSFELFDDRFFMYFEDVDLCRQIKNKNLKVIYFPIVTVIHDHVRASAQKPWYEALLQDSIARTHLKSAFKYFYKWRFK